MSMMIRRLMEIGGVKLPNNVRAYMVTPDSNTYTLTIPHDLGVVPYYAFVLNIYDAVQESTAAITFSFIITNNKTEGLYNAVQAMSGGPNSGIYNTTMPDCVLSNNSVSFTQSRYYQLQYKADTSYLCIICAKEAETVND